MLPNEISKEELKSIIVELEQTISTKEEKIPELRNETADLENKKAAIQKAYDELKEKLDSINREYHFASRTINELKYGIGSDKRKLDDYRRRYNKILDSEKLHAQYKEEYDAFSSKCLEAPWRSENRTDGLGAKEYQIDGAIRLALAKRGLLGDKMGLGKTLTSLIYADLVESKKVIIICPVDTMDNFIREINMWAPHRSPIKFGKKSKLERKILLDVVKNLPQYTLILNYEAWRKDDDLINDLVELKADTLILDEAHKIMDMSSKTSKGVMNLAFGPNLCPSCDNPDVKTNPHRSKAHCANCGYGKNGDPVSIKEFCSIDRVLPMTGTAILNKPQEIFPQLKLIDPDTFISINKFLDEYCSATYDQKWTWQYGGEKRVVEKIGPRYVARDRKTAGVEVPPSKPILHEIPMDELAEIYPKQYEAYLQARDYAQLVLDPNNNVAMSLMYQITVLLRLRQVLTWPAAITLKAPDEETGELKVVANLDVHESAKVDKAEELIRDIVDGGERVILFSQFKGPLIELEKRLSDVSVCRYDGDTSDAMKDAIAQDFDLKTAPENPRWNVCLGNYKSMGVGLNLHAATHAVILDEEWNPGKQGQAYGRINRLGQTRQTTIHTIRVTGKSVDDWMHYLIEQKRNLIEGFESEVSQQDLMREALEALQRGDM